MNVLLQAAIGILLVLLSSILSDAQEEVAVVKWGEWSDWSVCSVTCGGGIKTKERKCTAPGIPAKRCPQIRKRKCARNRCPRSDTTVAMLRSTRLVPSTPISTTETTKGEPTTQAVTTLTTAMPEPTPRPMSETMYQTATALTTAMPEPTPRPMGEPTNQNATALTTAVPEPTPWSMGDKPGPWSDWSSCNRPCGGGMRKRTRECPPPSYTSSKACKKEQSRYCNPFPCPDVYTPWSPWSACDESCVQFRSRVCVNDTGRTDCRFFQAQKCSENSCKVTSATMSEGMIPTPEPTAVSGLDSTSANTTIAATMPMVIPSTPEPTLGRRMNSTTTATRTTTTTTTTTTPAITTRTTDQTKAPRRSRKPRIGPEQRTDREMKAICGKRRIKALASTYQTALSPGYPKSYPAGLDCMWTVVAPRKSRIKIVINSFEASECCDKLTLLEGRPRENPYKEARIVTLTGNISAGAEYTSIGRYMTVRLQTGSRYSGGRYSIRFIGTREKIEEQEMKPKPDSAPDEEIWWKLIRMLIVAVYNAANN